MRPDLRGLVLRWATAWFLFTLVLLFVYLVGTAQSFLERVLATLFLAVKWSTWAGTLAVLFFVLPLVSGPRRVLLGLLLGLGFVVVLGFVLAWGSWVYPDARVALW